MFLLHLAAVDDENDVVDGDGRFGDVGREDDLLDAGRSSLEDELLILSRQRTVQRQNAEPLLVLENAVAWSGGGRVRGGAGAGGSGGIGRKGDDGKFRERE